jgi:hypothetical protein
MEGVFEVSFGPALTTLRRLRFRLYRRITGSLGFRLDEWETGRLYRWLIADEYDGRKRESLEYEHMWEQQQISERRAMYISDRAWSAAHRHYIETPPITAKEDDPNWIQGRYENRSYMTPAAVAELRAKIRAERKASWEPWLMWGSATMGWIAALAAIFLKR